jgi:fatty-acyl-CoA synthase
MIRQHKSYFHRGGNEPLLGNTIAEHFADVTERFAEHEAVVSLPQQKRLSYKALSAAVDQLAKGLVAIGFVKGDRIGVWSTNNIEWLMLQMATARIGAVLVNINPAYACVNLPMHCSARRCRASLPFPLFAAATM